MVTVKKLKPAQFARLERIFRDEFDSDTPLPSQCEIYGAFENGKLVGFLLAERVVMVGQAWTCPTARSNSVEIVMPLIRTVRDELDGKENVGTLASEPRFEALFRSLGMQKMDGVFYRKNI